jgi:hypothetical protein
MSGMRLRFGAWGAGGFPPISALRHASRARPSENVLWEDPWEDLDKSGTAGVCAIYWSRRDRRYPTAEDCRLKIQFQNNDEFERFELG